MRIRSLISCGILGAFLGLWGGAPEASAGDWSGDALTYQGQPAASLPLWYEYRASIDAAVGTNAATEGSWTVATVLNGSSASAVIWKGTTASPLTTPAGSQSYVMDLSPWTAAGWTSPGPVAQRQAALWATEHLALLEQHSALARSGYDDWTISALYATAEIPGGYRAGGYIRERLSPSTLSKPAVWTITGDGFTTSTVKELPLNGSDYGMVYSIAKADNGDRIYACGGRGAAGSFIEATCWDITSSASPLLVATPAALKLGANAVTTVVNRVRSVDLGPGIGLRTLAVGYLMQPNGATMGFLWDVAAGTVSFETALAPANDAILSDLTVQHYTQTSIANETTGRVFHGPMVVGTGTTSGTPRATTPDSNPVQDVGDLPSSNQHPAAVRGLAQTRIASTLTGASNAPTCNLELQVPTADLSSNLEMVSGVSRNGLYMVGTDAGGRLVRLANTLATEQIVINARRAHVYIGATSPLSEVYYWAELNGDRANTNVRVIWSNSAGCKEWDTGLACAADVNGTPEVQSTRHDQSANPGHAITPTADYTYIQAARTSGTSCDLTPVYAVADLNVNINPATTTIGAAEDWQDCGNVPAGRYTGGANVDTKRDYYHCGGCGFDSGAHGRTPCSEGRCINGSRQARATGVGCWIGGTTDWSSQWGQGTCYSNGARNPNKTTTAYRLINSVAADCGTSYTNPSYEDPCSICNQNNPTVWSRSSNAFCCTLDGVSRLDAYDRAQTWCSDTGWSYDRNDGRVYAARWKDPRAQWIYDQRDDWSSGGADTDECYANGSGDPHVIMADPGKANTSYPRPRRIDAFFTWPIDTDDWYEASFDDDGNGEPTPKPRARLISREYYPGTNRRVRMRLCLYVDVANGGRGDVNIKDMRAVDGINKTATHDGPANSPAREGRGQCVDTDDNGYADLVVYDYDNTEGSWFANPSGNDKEDAWVHFRVYPLDDISALHCDGTQYTLYIGNDKRAGQGPQGGYNAGKTGCARCCN